MKSKAKSRSRRQSAAETSAPPRRFPLRWFAILAAIFAFALAIRLYGGFTFGFGYDGPNSFRMINYDEAGGCRSLLGGRPYTTFVGRQVLFLMGLFGEKPSPDQYGEQQWRSFCHSATSILFHRVYSATTGALSVVLLGVLALLMWPGRPWIAWTACALLGFSNLHVAQSHFGTVDTPQLFFVGLFTVALAYAMAYNRRWPLWISPLLLIAAVWTKWYIFAVFAYLPVLPDLRLRERWPYFLGGIAAAAFLFVAVVGPHSIVDLISRHAYLLWGPEHGQFGTGYGHIGTWRRWIRNGINLPVVHIVGMALPVFVFAVYGLIRAVKMRTERPVEWRFWLLQTPAAAYALYMLVLAPPTYYRYYLPLFPAVALLSAYGFWESRWCTSKVLVALFLFYPALLTVDSEYNYRHDPRRAFREWLAEKPERAEARYFRTYYVVPPGNIVTSMFDPKIYLEHGADYLRAGNYLVMSENWYDTAFSNELNGPFGWNPDWQIKTTREAGITYRRILKGEEPALVLEKSLTLRHFTPELLVHRWCYGSFPLFVGDLMIYRIE